MGTTKPATALVTVINVGRSPDLKDAASQLGVAVEDIDPAFGVVPIDTASGVYCVQVVADRLPADFEQRKPYQGPFSDPGIAALRTGRGDKKTDR